MGVRKESLMEAGSRGHEDYVQSNTSLGRGNPFSEDS